MSSSFVNFLLLSLQVQGQDLKIVKLLYLGKQIVPDLEWVLHPFPLRTITSNLEVLILIHTTPHGAANCCSASWSPPPH